MSKVIAFDFGASSGRAIKATYKNGVLEYEELHRFVNSPIEKDGTLYWDFDALVHETRVAIDKAGAFDSLSFDTWGVDFGLLDKDGKLLAAPVHYRDARTKGIPQKAFKMLDAETLYECTGNQIMEINTLFQLIALKERQPDVFNKIDKLIFMPDLFAYVFGAKKVCGYSIASTSQMFDIAKKDWSGAVLDTFGIPRSLFAPFVKSGSVIGKYGQAKIISCAGHDTQCAVAAIPSQNTEESAFLSCGTWSLLGMELDAPILSKESMEASLSNELGADDKVNYLNNIIGLWLIQETRREWKRQGFDLSFTEMEEMARVAKPFVCFIDGDDARFTPPGDLPGRIVEFCRETGQQVPETKGAIIRCIYESLALKYRIALTRLQKMSGKKIKTLYLLGGGTKAETLCQMTADCLGVDVVAGPVEATVLGNVCAQLIALGDVPSLEAARALVAKTERVKRYTPSETQAWDEAYKKYTIYVAKRYDPETSSG